MSNGLAKFSIINVLTPDRATSHLCVKRERPLIISHSSYFKTKTFCVNIFALNILGKKNGGTHLESMALSQFLRPLLFVGPAQRECVVSKFMVTFGSFGSFAEL